MATAALSCALAVTGCSQYASSGELRSREQSRRSESQASETGPGQSILSDGQEDEDVFEGAETSRLETERTTAPMPEFEAVQDEVYVKSEGGGSVRIRSSCDTGDNSNILTLAGPGARLSRTGKNDKWTRVEINGAPGYISTEYITTEAPETKAVSGNTYAGSGTVTLDPPGSMRSFQRLTQAQPSCTGRRRLIRKI